MDNGVGSILREARTRRKIDLSEVEAATRIRLRYLRAIENEEWDVLPGGVYARGFIRTYASFLGLDGERLADDYRRDVEAAGSTSSPVEVPPSGSPPRRHGQRRPGPSLAVAAAISAVLLVAVLAVVLIPGGGEGGNAGGRQPDAAQRGAPTAGKQPAQKAKPAPAGVSVRLTASAEVWVCMLDAKGQHLVDGQILEAGAEEGPFHSGSFTVSFGNGEVSMLIDGKQADIPATSSPIGYSIDTSGSLTQLDEAERPSCA